jgi:hypothetical protein
MRTVILATSFLFAACLMGCGMSTTPPVRGPADFAVPNTPVPDAASVAPQLLSVSPTTLQRGTTLKIMVTGNLQAMLDMQQLGSWDFGTCNIPAFTYTPVDTTHCTLEPNVSINNTVGVKCDLTLTLHNGAGVLKLPAAFTITP